MKEEYIPTNVWCFSLIDSSDEDCVFAGLKKFFPSSSVFKFVVQWIPVIRNNTEITFSPKYQQNYYSCW